MRDLDDEAGLRRADTSHMLAQHAEYVRDFVDAFEAARGAKTALPSGISHIVVTGMGGSGIGGDLMAQLVRPESPLPVLVQKGYGRAGHVGRKTLLIAVSYSGETEETLDAALAAKAKGAKLVAVSSGGRLQQLARTARRPHFPLPPGRAPRAALPQLLGTLMGIAHGLGLTREHLRGDALTRLAHRVAALGPGSPEAANSAKSFARALHDRLPLIYGGPTFGAVALRARCQLNENAKMLARNDELPEANHNETVALDAIQQGDRYFGAFLRETDEPPEIHHRFEFVHKVLDRRGVPHHDFLAQGKSRLERVLDTLAFVDAVSLYTAYLRGVDAARIEVITGLKKLLETSGRAPAIRKAIP